MTGGLTDLGGPAGVPTVYLGFGVLCDLHQPPGSGRHSEHGRQVREQLVLLGLVVQDLGLTGSGEGGWNGLGSRVFRANDNGME